MDYLGISLALMDRLDVHRNRTWFSHRKSALHTGPLRPGLAESEAAMQPEPLVLKVGQG